MEEGRARAFGPKDEIMKQMMRPTAVPTPAGRGEAADVPGPQRTKSKTPSLKARA
jgi:ATP-binding cassette subfamily C protein